MKIRQGFVSNSSTTSFCIYGCKCTELSHPDIVKINELELEYHHDRPNDYDPNDYIGLSWCRMEDEYEKLLGSEFKDLVKTKVRKFDSTIEDDKFRTFTVAYYDG